MAQFKAFAPRAQVNGETILAVIAGLGPFEDFGKEMLDKAGIANPQPGQWYSQQAWLNAFWHIAQKVGPQTLWKIGTQIPERTTWPPSVDNIEKALASIDVAYHENHRGGEIGHYQYEKTGARTATMVCQTPYPDDFDRGLIGTVAKKFKPEGSVVVVVRHVDNGPCRKKGADSCTYLLKW